LTTTIAPMLSDDDSWRDFVTGQRWLRSPAAFYVAVPQATPARLIVSLCGKGTIQCRRSKTYAEDSPASCSGWR
jgi:hypothetical protein